VTAGEGGACLTDDADLALKIWALARQGIMDGSYRPTMIGLNYKMTDLQAAVLCPQLGRLPEYLKRRSEIIQRYRKTQSRLLPPMADPSEVQAPWLYAGCFRTEALLNDFKAELNRQQIGHR